MFAGIPDLWLGYEDNYGRFSLQGMTLKKNKKNICPLLHLLLFWLWDPIGGNHEIQIIIQLFSLKYSVASSLIVNFIYE